MKHYFAGAGANRHKLVHETVHPALTNTNRSRTTIGVGEEVDFRFVEDNFPTNAVWTATSGSFDSSIGNSVRYTARSNAGNATVTADVGGTAKLKIKFDVKEPSGGHHKQVPGTGIRHLQGFISVGFLSEVHITPSDVSFYRIEAREGSCQGVGTGFFAFLNDVVHQMGNWFPVDPSNQMIGGIDNVGTGDYGPPFSPGDFSWPIPQEWKIGAGPTNQYAIFTHHQTSDSSGNATIEKGGVGPFTKNSSDPNSSH